MQNFPPATGAPTTPQSAAAASPETPSAAAAVQSAGPSAAEIEALIAEARPRPWWKRRGTWAALVVLALLVGGGLLGLANRQTEALTPRYVTAPAQRGDLRLTVIADGTLSPTRSVTIGSELSGTVRRVMVDVNDPVKQGQVLLELDTAKLAAQVQRSRASLASARARVEQAEATVAEAQASLKRYEEVARLSGGKVPSATEFDTARATLARARADHAAARASVEDAKAALSTDETNLSKASIRSPIDGVVLARSVEPGQAVAATLQAVTLMTLAEDLSQLQLEVMVDEADVGAVQPGQTATFTVSAYPSRNYPARIARVDFGSTTTDNVVTYVALLEVDNGDRSLRPGMTASATIIAAEHHDVLQVPNTALRFTPAQAAPGGSPGASSSGGGIVSRLMPRRPQGAPRSARPSRGAESTAGAARQVWVLRDGVAHAVAVRTGISDGRFTEVTDGDLEPGMQVITEQLSSRAAG